MVHRNSSTPAATKTVAVFGGGIAGLAAAHELARLQHRVTVYEAAAEVGGFFRSTRTSQPRGMPTEYSWHGLGPWYHNSFDLLRQIPAPAEGAGSLFDCSLSRPIDFGVFPDDGPAQFYDRRWRSIPAMFRLGFADTLAWAWIMAKTWCADRRSQTVYARLNAAARWQRVLSPRAAQTWRSCFGPWIGSDWTRVSLHHAGQFFRKQLLSQPAHLHRADTAGPAWRHGAGDGWLLFRGPSSEYWFDPWIRQLKRQGVNFVLGTALHRLNFDGRRVTSAELASGEEVRADAYVLATTPFAAQQIIERTPALLQERELRRFRPLIADGPHVQVSFRLAFAEAIAFPRPRAGVVVADSEFNLTLFAQEQAWDDDVELGEQVKSLWTGTCCVDSVPGRVHGRPLRYCTEAQFIDEVKAQIFGCHALNQLVAAANGGRPLAAFPLLGVYVWHEWQFSPRGITGPMPKWVTTTHTQPHLPRQVTSLPNLFLAGAHTRTEVDVWSIEGAVESGRRAARGIDSRVSVIRQYKPRWLRRVSRVDDVCHALRLPHVLDLAVGVVAVGAVYLVWRWWRGRAGAPGRMRAAAAPAAGLPIRPRPRTPAATLSNAIPRPLARAGTRSAE